MRGENAMMCIALYHRKSGQLKREYFNTRRAAENWLKERKFKPAPVAKDVWHNDEFFATLKEWDGGDMGGKYW